MASDYDLVVANFKMKLKVRCCPRASVFVLTWINLGNRKSSPVFPTQIDRKFAALNLIDCKRDTIANDTKEGLLVTVEEGPGGDREIQI